MEEVTNDTGKREIFPGKRTWVRDGPRDESEGFRCLGWVGSSKGTCLSVVVNFSKNLYCSILAFF